MICHNNLGLVLIYTYVMFYDYVECKSVFCNNVTEENSSYLEGRSLISALNKSETVHLEQSDKHLKSESFLEMRVYNTDSNDTELRHNRLTIIRTNYNKDDALNNLNITENFNIHQTLDNLQDFLKQLVNNKTEFTKSKKTINKENNESSLVLTTERNKLITPKADDIISFRHFEDAPALSIPEDNGTLIENYNKTVEPETSTTVLPTTTTTDIQEYSTTDIYSDINSSSVNIVTTTITMVPTEEVTTSSEMTTIEPVMTTTVNEQKIIKLATESNNETSTPQIHAMIDSFDHLKQIVLNLSANFKEKKFLPFLEPTSLSSTVPRSNFNAAEGQNDVAHLRSNQMFRCSEQPRNGVSGERKYLDTRRQNEKLNPSNESENADALKMSEQQILDKIAKLSPSRLLRSIINS